MKGDEKKGGRTQSKMSGQRVNAHLIGLFSNVSAVLHRCHNVTVCSKYVCVCVCLRGRAGAEFKPYLCLCVSMMALTLGAK